MLQDAGLRHEMLDYGTVRWTAFRKRTLTRIADLIVEATERQRMYCPGSRTGVIAHSLGTLGLGRALQTTPALQLGRLVVFGCILKRGFPWRQFVESRRVQGVLHEIGGHDPWPLVASCLWRAGASGRCGFRECDEIVHERRYEWNGHDNLVKPIHCRSVWVPFLTDGKVPPAA